MFPLSTSSGGSHLSADTACKIVIENCVGCNWKWVLYPISYVPAIVTRLLTPSIAPKISHSESIHNSVGDYIASINIRAYLAAISSSYYEIPAWLGGPQEGACILT